MIKGVNGAMFLLMVEALCLSIIRIWEFNHAMHHLKTYRVKSQEFKKHRMLNKILSSAGLVLLIGCFFATEIAAQGSGRITGVVTDQASGETLAGATVQVVGTNRGVVTDQNGRYNLVNVSAGSVELQVSYIGYQRRIVETEIQDGETVELDIAIRWNSVEGEEISITAQAMGQIRAINEQRSSNTISNIVSSDRIQELPDVSAAESIGRLPGVSIQRSGGEANKIAIRGLSPKYNSVTINGVKMPSTSGDDRSVDLSLVSSNMLDGIEVKKANTPDMDADAFGGSVDLRLREAPEVFSVDVSAQGGYTHLQESMGNYKFSGTVSNRFFTNRLGMIITANVDEFDRSADKYTGGYEALQAQESIRVTQTTLREENVTRGRTGGSFVIDYRIPNGKLAANSFFNRSESEGLYRINNMNAGGNRHYFDMELRENTTDLFTGSAGIEQNFDWIQYDFTVSRTMSRADNPEDFSWRFGKEGAAFTSQPTLDTHPTDIPGFAVNDSLSTLTHIWVSGTQREENVTAAKLNFQMPFETGWTNGYVKFGGKLMWLDRFNDETQIGRSGLQYGNGGGLNDPLACIDGNLSQYDLQGAADQTGDGGLPLLFFLDDYKRDDFLQGNYGLGFTYRADMMRQVTRALQSCGGPDNRNYRPSAIGSQGRDYDGIERYQAAYIMAEFDFFNSQVKLIPGVRWEADYSRYNGQRFIEQVSAFQESEPADFTELTNSREHSFILPMVHLQYSPTDWVQVRVARTETLSRPDYIQYAPITTMNTFRDYVRAANGALSPAHSKNYDLSVSIYENRIGYFSVSAFQKTISDLILSLNYKVHPDVPQLEGMNLPQSWVDEAPTWGADTYTNNPYDATYRGIEFDWQTNFWYLPSVLQGIVLNANYTLMDSEMTFQRYFLTTTDSVKVGGRPPTYYRGLVDDSLRTGRMPDQPKNVANITMGYDYKGFSTRISYLHQSDVSSGINLNNPILDTFTGSYSRWDLSIRQKLGVGLEVYGNFNNLTSTQDRTFRSAAGATNRPAYIENYGFTMDMGVRYRF